MACLPQRQVLGEASGLFATAVPMLFLISECGFVLQLRTCCKRQHETEEGLFHHMTKATFASPPAVSQAPLAERVQGRFTDGVGPATTA